MSTDPPPSSASACEPYRELIAEALARGRNARAIWQDLVDDHAFGARYASVLRFVRRLRGTQSPEARVVTTTAPGEECQVDYGEGPMVRHQATGKYRRTRLFVLTLGYSRKSVRLIVPKSSTRIWAELYERAFRQLGGAPRVTVLDNLREGVLTPDVYDPTLNPLFRDVLAHYGVVALPCRIRDPDRKGKVESGVGHAQRTPLRGLRFESIEQAQAYLDRWEANWADTRIHGTTKRQVAVMFCRGAIHAPATAARAFPLLPARSAQSELLAQQASGAAAAARRRWRHRELDDLLYGLCGNGVIFAAGLRSLQQAVHATFREPSSDSRDRFRGKMAAQERRRRRRRRRGPASSRPSS